MSDIFTSFAALVIQFLFTKDIQLASHIGKVSESLLEESRNKHALRARLCNELVGTLKVVTEPTQSIVASFPELYNSAMMAGDVENAMICRMTFCVGSFWTGASNLVSLAKHYVQCIQEAVGPKETICPIS